MSSAPAFDTFFRARLRELLIWRRDVRRFRPDPLPPGSVEELLELAFLAPSVGLSQPWWFILNQYDVPIDRPVIISTMLMGTFVLVEVVLATCAVFKILMPVAESPFAGGVPVP